MARSMSLVCRGRNPGFELSTNCSRALVDSNRSWTKTFKVSYTQQTKRRERDINRHDRGTRTQTTTTCTCTCTTHAQKKDSAKEERRLPIGTLPRDPHLQKRTRHLDIVIPPRTLPRLLRIYMLQRVPEMALNHVRGRDALDPLRGVQVRGRGRGRGDGVDGRGDQFDEGDDEFGGDLGRSVRTCTRKKKPNECTHGGRPAIKVVQILVERVTVNLNSDDFLRRRVRDAERFLEAFEHAFAILVWVLAQRQHGTHGRGTGLTALASSPSSLSFPPSLPSLATSPSPSASSSAASCHHKWLAACTAVA